MVTETYGKFNLSLKFLMVYKQTAILSIFYHKVRSTIQLVIMNLSFNIRRSKLIKLKWKVNKIWILFAL